MQSQPTLLYHSAHGEELPALVAEFAKRQHLRVLWHRRAEDVLEAVRRALPVCVVVDGSDPAEYTPLCQRLKLDPFSAIVPIVLLLRAAEESAVIAGFEARTDEVLTDMMPPTERMLRLRGAVERAERDVSVNPTTRLPGTVQIERDIAERMRAGGLFAVCYADLDHFKEFNDRYGYNHGDRVILLVSRIIRDIVIAHAPTGFIGHIGGDDFIFSVPLEAMRPCCEDIIDVFDTLAPFQYTPADRRAGYFLGKDRRGMVYRIPLMTISIGVVTNQQRRFSHTARVGELATEMKLYAKSLPGSVYAVDRRSDDPAPDPGLASASRGASSTVETGST